MYWHVANQSYVLFFPMFSLELNADHVGKKLNAGGCCHIILSFAFIRRYVPHKRKPYFIFFVSVFLGTSTASSRRRFGPHQR